MKKLQFLVFILIIISAFTHCKKYESNLVIENTSSELISSLLINVCGKEYLYEGVEIDGKEELEIIIKGDCHYSITVEFEKGEKLRAETGYLTKGFNYQDIIRIDDNEITLISKTGKK
jgi:hypothetical protein